MKSVVTMSVLLLGLLLLSACNPVRPLPAGSDEPAATATATAAAEADGSAASPEKQGDMITATARTALSWHLGPIAGNADVVCPPDGAGRRQCLRRTAGLCEWRNCLPDPGSAEPRGAAAV